MINVTLADLDTIGVEEKWNSGDENDYLMHTIGIFDEKKFDDVCDRTLTLMKELEAEISEKLRIEIEKAKGASECETESTISKCD